MRKNYLRSLMLLFVVGLSVVGARQPNIVFIVADDLGWADTTLYGETALYQTPNLERLAKRGMTFTRAYAASPLCSPTRASILTGLNPARIGITAPTCHTAEVLHEPLVPAKAAAHIKTISLKSVSRFHPKYCTLAERLKDEGYATGHFGKWHLGPEPYSPLEHGFDVDIPHWHGPGPAGSFVAPWKFKDFKARTPKEHIEDRMADEAVTWMETHRDHPFFMNYWQFSVHAPFDAKAKVIEKYRKLIDPEDPQRSPTYAAMVEAMDDAVGTLLDALDRLKLTDNTIIIFFSDNGGNMYNEVDGTTPTSNAPLRGGKASMYDGGVRVPCVVSWPGKVAADAKSDALVQSTDFYPTILEMLDLKTDLAFDGVSFHAALKGEAFERDAIFTYFPHAPGVPDNLPPSVSVHQGDWKLIRVFFGGDGTQHGYQLYNLAEDIGEQNNVATQYPERVGSMDALIETFLRDTKAVLPALNPAYNPNATPGARSAKKKKPVVQVAGWAEENHCQLTVKNNQLQIKSTGGDPHLSYAFKKAFPAGQYKLELELELHTPKAGEAQLFWRVQGVQPAFFRDRSHTFPLVVGGENYVVPFEASGPLTGIRFDPLRAVGQVDVARMVLKNAAGEDVYRWRF